MRVDWHFTVEQRYQEAGGQGGGIKELVLVGYRAEQTAWGSPEYAHGSSPG